MDTTPNCPQLWLPKQFHCYNSEQNLGDLGFVWTSLKHYYQQSRSCKLLAVSVTVLKCWGVLQCNTHQMYNSFLMPAMAYVWLVDKTHEFDLFLFVAMFRTPTNGTSPYNPFVARFNKLYYITSIIRQLRELSTILPFQSKDAQDSDLDLQILDRHLLVFDPWGYVMKEWLKLSLRFRYLLLRHLN
jgi:hypothetical protein